MKKKYANLTEALKEIISKSCGLSGHFINGSMTIKIDDTRNVILKILEKGTHHHWEGISARIVHKTNGKIVEQFFSFEEGMRLDPKANKVKELPIYLWEGLGFTKNSIEWYGVPTDDSVFEYVDAIDDWIAAWK